MAYNLKQITHNNEPIIIPLPEAEVIIGTNNVQLQTYPQMSEQHAKFYKIENSIAIRDLNSRYGTYVNDVRIGSDTMFLKPGDIIGFGVNTKSAENGFVCVLICDPFKGSYNNRKQPVISVKKEPPEIIDLSQDDEDEMPKIAIDSVKTVNPTCLDFKTSDVQKNASPLCNENVEILIEGWEHAKNVNSVPSTSKGNITSFKKRYPHTKKFFVPLIRCDSESFLWPPDVKNPFLLESEDDEDILSICKKRPKRISDSSVESSEEESPRSFSKKPKNKQNQVNNNVDISKSSSKEQTDYWKNFLRRHKKRARKISSDSSDESSVESNNSIYHKSKKSFLNQSKTENIPSSGFVALPESSSPDFSVKKLDKNVSSNIAKSSTSNSAIESLNLNFHLNSLSKSDMETDEYSSHKSNQLNIQKTEVGKKLFPIPDYITNTKVMEYDLKKDSYHKQFNKIDSDSVAKEIINESDSVFDTDIVQNSIPIKSEPEDSKNPESDNINETNSVFDTDIVQNSIPIKTEPEDSKNPESDNINVSNSVFDTDIMQNSIPIKTEPEDYKNPESDNINESNSVFDTDIVQNSIPIKTEPKDYKNPQSDNINESDNAFDTDIVQNYIPIKTELEDSKNPESDNINESNSVFDADIVQNSIPIKTELEDSKNLEFANINESNSVFDTDILQNSIPIKTEFEDSKNPESDNIIKEIFEGDDESEVLPSGALSKNSALENQEIESIETIQQFVNCTTQKNSAESESGRNEELNSKLTHSEFEMPPEEDLLPSVKSLFRNSKYGDKKNSKSSGKTLLTDPKPMTYRPRKMRGRDEGYVERQKTLDLYPKRKRGRPRKEEQLQSEAMILSSSGTKIPDKSEEWAVPLSNLKLTPVPKDKDTPETDPAEAKYAKSATKPFLNSKLTQKSFDPFAESEEGTSKKCREVEHEASTPHKQLSKIPEKCKEKISANDYLKNKGLPSSTDTKDPRKNTKSTVKIRPQKLTSRMGFLTNGEEAKPVRRDKISGKSKKYEGASNAEKNDVPQTQFVNKIRDEGHKGKVDEKNIIPGNAPPINCIEDKHPEQQRSSFSHTVQIKNSEDNIFQKIPHSFTNADTLHVKNLKDNTFQDILHSSADASSTHTLPVKNLGNNNFQNIPHSLTDASHRISIHAENSQLPFELSFNGMVKSLLKLKTVWLEEQCKNSQPPPLVMQDVKTLPLRFPSYEFYAASFYPLLKLKIWQCLFESSKKVLSNKKKRFNFRVLSFVKKTDYIELKCESIANDKYCFEPREGMMTVLEMRLNTNIDTNNGVYPLFGFILKHKVDTLNENLLHSCWKKTSAEYLKDAKHWIFHVWIKQKELLFEPDILMEGNCLCYVRNDLNLVDALRCFKDSPLMTDIIEPRLQTFALSCSKYSSSRKYTSQQFDIIQAICSEIYKPYLECKITLIRGPPGMGKTRIIIGILETLFYASKCNSNLKVLVTAPSNRAVDEIGCRLIELNEQYGWNNCAFKFVRVGVEDTVHSKMLPYFVDRKAAELYKKHKERELQDLRLKILNLEKEPNSLNKEKQLKSLNDQCKYINDNISLETSHYKTKIKYRCDVLKESNIVLTTLSSCNLSLLCRTFSPTSKSDLNFSCCIVDESTQCSEMDILQPLAFGISKLVLIGDEKQSPAAGYHLECVNKYHFCRSMLDRFYQYFEHSNQPNPVVYLTE